MDKSHTDFLQEYKSELEALKLRLAALEEKIATLQAEALTQADAPEPEPIAAVEPIPEPEPLPAVEPIPEPDPEPETIPEPVDIDLTEDAVEVEIVAEPVRQEPEAVPETVSEDPVDFTEIRIGEAEEVARTPGGQPAERRERGFGKKAEPAAADKDTAPIGPETVADDTAAYPWRKDRPGIPVKNIRSGISLLDRAMFIGTLFQEDAQLYDATLADLNALSTLEEAVAYIRAHFPEWDLGSNPVYHFMMSIRKKLG